VNKKALALVATVRLLDDEIGSSTRMFGQSLTVGDQGGLCVPVPQGAPYVASVDWVGPYEVQVTDGRGGRTRLADGDRMSIGLGEFEVRLGLVPRYRLRRSQPLSWQLSMAWFVIVFGSTLGVTQVERVIEKRCEWFGLTPELRVALRCTSPEANADGSGFNAEYLARLLREDYEGADDGVILPTDISFDEPQHHSAYLPAGGEGPITEMGGAEEVADEPERTPEADAVEPAAAKASEQQIMGTEVGTPVQEPSETESGSQVADEGFDDESEEEPVEDSPSAAEEIEGWGLSDWMDTTAERRESVEIDLMLRLSRERLRINPDDPEALGVLAYYQYLATDYDDALETFNRLIELYPGEAYAYNNKALVYKRKGMYRKEEGLYRIALALDPADATAINNLAVNLAHQDRHAEALDWMRQLKEKTPDDPYADLHRAKIYADMGNTEEAIRYLILALEGMKRLDTLHHIEFRQDIRLDPSFADLRRSEVFKATLRKYYGDDSPVRD